MASTKHWAYCGTEYPFQKKIFHAAIEFMCKEQSTGSNARHGNGKSIHGTRAQCLQCFWAILKNKVGMSGNKLRLLVAIRRNSLLSTE